MMENVKGLVTKKFLPFFHAWLKELEKYGYASFYKILNAKDYGIPQNRERIFVISIRIDDDKQPEYNFPNPQKLLLRVNDLLEEEVDEKFFMSNERVNEFLEKVDVNEYVKEAESLQNLNSED